MVTAIWLLASEVGPTITTNRWSASKHEESNEGGPPGWVAPTRPFCRIVDAECRRLLSVEKIRQCLTVIVGSARSDGSGSGHPGWAARPRHSIRRRGLKRKSEQSCDKSFRRIPTGSKGGKEILGCASPSGLGSDRYETVEVGSRQRKQFPAVCKDTCR